MGCTLSGLVVKSSSGDKMAEVKVEDLQDIANKLRVLSIKSTEAAGSGYVLIKRP